MSPRSALAHASATLVLLIAAPAAHAAWPHDPYTNVPLTSDFTAYAAQTASCPDGAGGAVVVWDETTGQGRLLFAQHVLASGTVDPLWPAAGLQVSTTAGGDQQAAAIAHDPNGGFVIAWSDGRNGVFNIWAQRLTILGARLWTSTGVRLSTSPQGKNDTAPQIACDPFGIYVSWSRAYTFPTDNDVYLTRVDFNGVQVTGWGADGFAVAANSADQVSPGVTAIQIPGNQGPNYAAFVTWADKSNLSDYDIYAEVVKSDATVAPGWNPGGNDLTPLADDQSNPVAVASDDDHVFVAWHDRRNGNYDIYAQRVADDASLGFGSSTGIGVLTGPSDQYFPVVASDGAGGAVIVASGNTSSSFLLATRVTAAGAWAPGFSSAGLEIDPGGPLGGYSLVGDGTGGAILGWTQEPALEFDLYATRIAATGGFAPGWSHLGTAVSLAPRNQYFMSMAADGSSGAILGWVDTRNSSGNSAYAQRIDRWGALGNAEPVIAAVQDVKADQGGSLLVRWSPSYLDADPTYGVGSYWVWRAVPLSAASAAVARGGRWLDEATVAALRGGVAPASLTSGGLFTRTSVNGTSYAWEYVSSTPAAQLLSYSAVVPTTSDSTAGHNPYTAVMIQAHAPSGPANWSSAPDSGYSVDNLAPATPSPFTGTYAGGTTTMAWGANHESDFDHYALYRGLTPGFTPAAGDLVTTTTNTGDADAAGQPYYYKLTAVDVHGNASAPALLLPSGVTAVGDGPQRTLFLAEPAPNPASASARVRFGLSRDGPARLALYDAGGREVSVIADGALAAGPHAITWAAGGALPPGRYWLRLEAEGRTLVRAVTIAR